MNRTLLLITLIGLAGIAPVHAQEEPAAATAEAEVDDSSVDQDRLTRELTWHTDLKEALAKAKEENRLLFWVQMKGKIDGYT